MYAMRMGWILALALMAGPAMAGKNLVQNGSFNDATNRLSGWKSLYNLPGESWYADNVNLVSVVDEESGRHDVLCLYVKTQFLADNPGVKVDSKPVPAKPGERFRLSAWCRTDGPNCRFMVEGYKWRPGIKPHPDPQLHELRLVYKFDPLSFSDSDAGKASNPGPAWKSASQVFPEKARSKLQQAKLDEIQFLVIHICAVMGSLGHVYVDDVRLEKLGPGGT